MNTTRITSIAKANSSSRRSTESVLRRKCSESIHIIPICNWIYNGTTSEYYHYSLVSSNEFGFEFRQFRHTAFTVKYGGISATLTYDIHQDSYELRLSIKENETDQYVIAYLSHLKARRAEMYHRFHKMLYKIGKSIFAGERDSIIKYPAAHYLTDNGIPSKTYRVWVDDGKDVDQEMRKRVQHKISYCRNECLTSFDEWFPSLFTNDKSEYTFVMKDIKCIISRENSLDKRFEYSNLTVSFIMYRGEDDVINCAIDNIQRSYETKIQNYLISVITELDDEEWFIDGNYAVLNYYLIWKWDDMKRNIRFLMSILPSDKFSIVPIMGCDYLYDDYEHKQVPMIQFRMKLN